MKRNLAAIVALDVVGYSRLMAVDENGTLQRLTAIRTGIVEPAIKTRGGRIVKLMGDGLLAEFPSVVEAVAAAAGIQSDIALSEGAQPEDRRIVLRAGINLGDIIHEGSDIYGDGVNVAARLEAISDPGGIAVSGTVFEHVRGKINLAFEDIGEQQLKNIDRPIRVFRVSPERADQQSEPNSLRKLDRQRPTVAVLAFENLSRDPEQDYFSDGLTEDLITELSRFKELAVVSRNSTFSFKGMATTLREIGEKLGARYIVEGSVQKAARRIRITAQLIDAEHDNHIWAERYDRDLEDLFDVQDDVVRRVASTLVDRLEHDDQRRAGRISDDQLQAYDLYLRGREHFFSWSIDANRHARQALKAALALEPDYAAAQALYSEIVFRDWLNGWSETPDQDLAEALEAATRADEIDPQDSRTQVALGMLTLFHRQYDKSKFHFESALRANPNDTRVPVYFSRFEVFAGSPDRAVELCRSAQELNPFGKYHWNVAIAHFTAKNYADAINSCESIRNPPEPVVALLAASYAMVGDQEKASEIYARFFQRTKTSPMMSKLDGATAWRQYFAERWPFKSAADLDHLISALGKAGMPT